MKLQVIILKFDISNCFCVMLKGHSKFGQYISIGIETYKEAFNTAQLVTKTLITVGHNSKAFNDPTAEKDAIEFTNLMAFECLETLKE